MKVGTVLCGIAALVATARATPLKGPEAEVKKSDIAVKLPPVPDFALAPPSADAVDPRELRINGKAHFGQDVAVRGYVIWIYECLPAVRAAGESKAAAQKRIDDDPTLCERAKLYLGSDMKTPVEKGLWVVDVPRPPNKLELERLPKEKLDAWPLVPKFKVGEYVTIKGRFDTSSPHSERNSDGLLVFASIEPAHPGPRAGKAVPMALHADPAPAIPAAPSEVPVAPATEHTSSNLLNAGNKLLGQNQAKDALPMYEGALKAWPQNHLAAYGAGIAHIELREYAAAVSQLDRCVELAPDQSMYQMWLGIAAYEAAVDQAKVSQAALAGRKPEQIDPDLSKVNFTKASEHLELAVAENADLWRAHYYLGRIWRAQGAARDAATEFSKTIAANPREYGPYVALGELYRKWDYTDAAIAVMELGSRNVTGTIWDVFFVLGMAYEDKGNERKAIDAYTLSLAAKDTNAKARFQRGQAYFKIKDFAKAKADLDAFMAASSANLEFARQQASKMLADMADKH